MKPRKNVILEKYCSENNLELVPTTYRFRGAKAKGFDICKGPSIIIALEPVSYSNGDKWYIRMYHDNYDGKLYLKRITVDFLKGIDLSQKSGYINSNIESLNH